MGWLPDETGLDRCAANHVPLTPLSHLQRAADVFANREALVYRARRWSYAQYHARVSRLASALVGRGIRPGDVVATLLPNIPAQVEAHFGVPAAGAVLNTINVRLDTDTVAYIFGHGGAKLVLVDGPHGRMDPTALERTIRFTGRAGVHNVQRGMVTLTNVTETGTVHSVDQVAELAGIARAHGLPVHMDGARFANALVASNASPAEMTWKAGVDALSFGGTKNGLMGVEAVILFDPARAWEFELRRKRGGHLFSKYRYLAAQMDAYLEGDLWLRLASQANAMGRRLAEGLSARADAGLLHPTEANMVFARFPRAVHRRLQAAGARYYLWPFDQSLDGPGDEQVSCRLVCSWSTTAADVDGFLATMDG